MLEKFRKNFFLYNLAFRFKMFLDGIPWLYISILKIHRRNKNSLHDIVSKDTQITIDGYPRSANSFASESLRFCEPNIKISTHMHVSSNIIQSCKMNIPTIVLIRKPKDAAVSWKCLSLEINDDEYNRKKSISTEIKAYIYFYKRLIRYKDKFVLAKFEEVTTNYKKIIEQVNEKFGTNFYIFEHSKENEQKIFNLGGFHLSPSNQRNSFKKEVYQEIEHPKNAKLLKKAEDVYNKLVT